MEQNLSDQKMNIQWDPGHMTKTRRMMEENLKLVDAVCEILDARIPISSRNPDIDAICGTKPRLVILNRIDMADPAMVKKWAEYFKSRGMAAAAFREAAAVRGKGTGRKTAQDHGRGHPECREVHLYQPDRGTKGRKGGKPPRRHARQTVDHGRSGAFASGHAGHFMAEV